MEQPEDDSEEDIQQEQNKSALEEEKALLQSSFNSVYGWQKLAIGVAEYLKSDYFTIENKMAIEVLFFGQMMSEEADLLSIKTNRTEI